MAQPCQIDRLSAWCQLMVDGADWFRRVGPGRGAGIAPGPFPRTSRRTRRAPLDATGSPRFLSSGWFSRPGVGDLAAAVAVPGDLEGRDPPQFGLARCDRQPP